MSPQMNDIVIQALQSALEEAESRRHTEVADIHLLKELLSAPGGYFSTFIQAYQLDSAQALKKIEEALKRAPTFETSSKPAMGASLQAVIQEAQALAAQMGRRLYRFRPSAHGLLEDRKGALRRLAKENPPSRSRAQNQRNTRRRQNGLAHS